MIYTIEQIKTIILPIAKKYRLKAVYLFGSYARGAADEDSDIDLMIDTAGSGLDTLFKLGALYDELSRAFCKEIDLITVASFEQPTARPGELAFRETVLKERKNLYAAA